MTTQTTLEVADMTCGACVEHVRDALAIDGVSDVHVDLEAGRVTCTHAPTIAASHLIAALEQAGYGAKTRTCCGCC